MILILALLQASAPEAALQKLAPEIPALLKAADKDGNGTLSNVEFREFAPAVEKSGKAILAALDPSIAQKKKEKDLEKYDANKDKALDDAEKKAMADAKHLKDIKDFDWDEDGKLNEREKTAMGWAAEGKSDGLFRQADKNADGQLSAEEAVAGLAAIADIKIKKAK